MSILEEMKDYQMSSRSAYQVFSKLHSDNSLAWYASMELMLRSLNQWEVGTGQYLELTCINPKALIMDYELRELGLCEKNVHTQRLICV